MTFETFIISMIFIFVIYTLTFIDTKRKNIYRSIIKLCTLYYSTIFVILCIKICVNYFNV